MSKRTPQATKQLLFSITKKDFEIQTFCTGGKGGQNQNKRKMGCRLIHIPSGAVGEGREERSYERNKKNALYKLIKTDKFIKWHKLQCAKALGIYDDIEKTVEQAMRDENLRVEVKVNGKWVPLESAGQ